MTCCLPELSVVIPVYNEEENLKELYSRLVAVIGKITPDYEIIFVNDGSSDNTQKILLSFAERNPSVKVIKFTRNFGHHIAVTAGLDYCRGKAAVIMDADLQDQPEEIPRLLDKMAENYDIVYGIRINREDSWFKKLTSKFFVAILKRLTNYNIDINSNIFRVMSRRVIDSLASMKETDRYLLGLISYTGYPQTGIPVKHGKRFAGKTKYSFTKMMGLFLNAVTSFSVKPLGYIGVLGILVSLVSFTAAGYLVYRRLVLGLGVEGWTSIMVTLFLVSGIQLLSLGVIGAYIGRIFTQVRNRPLYIIESITEYPVTKR